MKLAAIVLAAGSARRFGGDKLSADFRGEPLLAHAVRAARAAPVERVIVVGHDAGDWPGGPAVECLSFNSTALSDTLAAGIAAVSDTDGAFVFLGDMPLIPHGLAAQLADALGDSYAAAPRRFGIAGHPVLFARRAFADLIALKGDAGAGRILRGRSDVVWIDVADEGVLLDVDRPDDIGRLSALNPPSAV